jgi:hypothetical protein
MTYSQEDLSILFHVLTLNDATSLWAEKKKQRPTSQCTIGERAHDAASPQPLCRRDCGLHEIGMNVQDMPFEVVPYIFI